MPIRSSSRERSLPRRITPIEPVMVPGLATILSAATPTYTPPEAEMLPKLATTRQPFCRRRRMAA
jgi:hypothetical protein